MEQQSQSNALSQAVEREVRTLLGEQMMQIIVLRQMLEMAQQPQQPTPTPRPVPTDDPRRNPRPVQNPPTPEPAPVPQPPGEPDGGPQPPKQTINGDGRPFDVVR